MSQFASKHWIEGDRLLRRDIRLMGWMLRRVVSEELSPGIWEMVHELRELAGAYERGEEGSCDAIVARCRTIPVERRDDLMRVLGLFFDLANVSEDLQRERVLLTRRQQGCLTDDLPHRLAAYAQREPDEERRGRLLRMLKADFVMTAHPTEAKRQSVRKVLKRLRETLLDLEACGGNRESRQPVLARLQEVIRMLLRTDPLHSHRPNVLEELGRALYVSDALWEAVPGIVMQVEQAGGSGGCALRFGCWIGGDRDGHPDVTTEVTRETFRQLRHRAVCLHLQALDPLIDCLTALCRDPRAADRLEGIVRRGHCAASDTILARCHPQEHYRRALESMRLRLLATDGVAEAPVYHSRAELLADIDDLRQALCADGLEGAAGGAVDRWRACANAFGCQLMRLDLRENSDGFRALVHELLEVLGDDPERERRDDFEGLWDRVPACPGWESLAERLSEPRYDLLRVIDLFYEQMRLFSEDAIGPTVISMTHSPADVLWVLWLQRLVAAWRGMPDVALPIAPLFETIADLHGSAAMLETLFEHPVYAAHLARREMRQLVMIGYSDSAKDGGYLAACWSLYEGQETMQQVADRYGVSLTCFHGRGGALGRGGGPAARAIESLPSHMGEPRIRMTEQGEVVADRFADSALAYRHMEQVLGGLIQQSSGASVKPKAEWRALMHHFAETGREAYLGLLKDPGFVDYFREATPFACVEQLPIGSRPSRRHGAATLQDLRAIPYTFSWTQSRQLINAFFGLGSAWVSLSGEERDLACCLYREWSFFRAMIDNAELALSKCDTGMVRVYAGLMRDAEAGERIGSAIVAEINATREALRAITGQDDLLAGVGWLQRSVAIRKPYVDVLNLMQVELLRQRRQAGDEVSSGINRSLRLSVQAIAAGLRTTG